MGITGLSLLRVGCHESPRQFPLRHSCSGHSDAPHDCHDWPRCTMPKFQKRRGLRTTNYTQEPTQHSEPVQQPNNNKKQQAKQCATLVFRKISGSGFLVHVVVALIVLGRYKQLQFEKLELEAPIWSWQLQSRASKFPGFSESVRPQQLQFGAASSSRLQLPAALDWSFHLELLDASIWSCCRL